MRRVIQVIAMTALSVLGVGCATSGTSAHGPRHTDIEVAMAEQNTDCSTLTLMTASVDPETAQAARRLASGECH